MKKLTQSQAISRLKKKGNIDIIVIPCKTNINNIWGIGFTYNPTHYIIARHHEIPQHFKRITNEYKRYNCNSELGNRLHYYVNE